MSNGNEGMVLPEWGIHLRNLIDRMAPIVNEHHRDIMRLMCASHSED